jgi:hypothetical protein
MDLVFIVAIVAAIAMVSVVQMARALLALPVARCRFLLQPKLTAPTAWADLCPPLIAELAALDFSGPHWLSATVLDPDGETRPFAAFVHSDGHLAVASAPIESSPHLPQFFIASQVTDGFVQSHRFDWSASLGDAPGVRNYSETMLPIKDIFAPTAWA